MTHTSTPVPALVDQDDVSTSAGSSVDVAPPWRTPRVLGLAGVLIAVVAHRLGILFGTDFPINDGALFVAFIESTERSWPGLPSTVQYNGFDLPLAYPPLAFWVGGLLGRLGVDAVTVLHVMPVLLNIAWLLLLALLFWRDRRGPLFTAAAVGLLATMFRSYEWLVMGGGVTRGLGAVFLVLALLALRGTRGRDAEVDPLPLRAATVAGAFTAGALLSHLEWGLLTAASVVLQRALSSRTVRTFLVTTAVAAGTAALLVMPWALFVVSRHGLEPFLAASGTSGWYLAATAGRIAEFVSAQWPNVLLGVGVAVLLARRDLFWPLFILLCIVLTPRHMQTPLVVPVSYVTVAGGAALLEALRRFYRQGEQRASGLRVGAMGLGALAAIAVSWLALAPARQVSPFFAPLSRDVRDAMGWVRAEHSGSSFAIVSNRPWQYDATAEWFPELAHATSSTTVQGTEWLPDGAFARRERDVAAIRASRSCEEFTQRLLAPEPVRFVWAQARLECFDPPQFRRVFANDEVSIFEVREQATE